MKRTLIAAASLAALMAFAGTPALAEAKSAKEFVTDAIKGDISEVTLGRLAEKHGSSKDVRSFGRTLVTDHHKAEADAVKMAQGLGVSPPKKSKPEAQQEYAKLSKMSGAEFDREFISYMVDDHQKDIQEFQEEATADNGPAGSMAKRQLPVLQKHLGMAQSLQKKMNQASTQ